MLNPEFRAMDFDEYHRVVGLKFAEDALKSRVKDAAEFEIVQVLPFKTMELGHPTYELSQEWIHLIFTAKRKTDSSDGSPKHFFAEIYRDNNTGKRIAETCSTFEPNADPRFEHGCLICGADQKIHPGKTEFEVGRPPYFHCPMILD